MLSLLYVRDDREHISGLLISRAEIHGSGPIWSYLTSGNSKHSDRTSFGQSDHNFQFNALSCLGNLIAHDRNINTDGLSEIKG